MLQPRDPRKWPYEKYASSGKGPTPHTSEVATKSNWSLWLLETQKGHNNLPYHT